MCEETNSRGRLIKVGFSDQRLVIVLQIIETIVQIGVKAPNFAHCSIITYRKILAMEPSREFIMSATLGHFPKWPAINFILFNSIQFGNFYRA